MPLTPSDLSKRALAAWDKKDLWNGFIDECLRYARPQAESPYEETPGQSRTRDIYDSTLVNSTARFAARFQSELTPPFGRWAELQAGRAVPQQHVQEIRSRLSAYSDAAMGAIWVSNFDQAAGPFYLDLAIGTAHLLVLEHDDPFKPLLVQCVPAVQVAIDEGPGQTVDGRFRRREILIRLIEREWPDAKLPDKLKAELDKDQNAKVTLMECSYADPDRVGAYCYTVLWGQGQDAEPVVDRKGDDNPWITVRWSVASDECYGRGPVTQVLDDARTLNETILIMLENASIQAGGIYKYKDDSTFNPQTARLEGGAFWAVSSMDNIEAITPAGRIELAQLVVERMQMAVKEGMLDRALPPLDSPVRSPTEIVQRVAELQRDIGTPFGRVMREFIEPFLQRVLNILHRKRVIDIPVKIDGLVVRAHAVSPLAMIAQMADVQRVAQWLQLTGSLGPEVTALGVKIEDLPAWIGRKLNVPEELIRSAEERSTMQRAAAQAAAAQAQPAEQPAANDDAPPAGGRRPRRMAL